MGCLKLLYHNGGNVLEENSSKGLRVIRGSEEFWDTHIGKKAGEQKNRINLDHLGNGRVWWTFNSETNQPEVLQTADYYPFGMQHADPQSSQIGLVNKYQYNGHLTDQLEVVKRAGLGMEKIDDFGLNVQQAYYRIYDPQIGRMWQIDPMSEENTLISWSPYNWSFNNPISFSDPLGDFATRKEARQFKKDNNLSGIVRKHKGEGANFQLNVSGDKGEESTTVVDGAFEVTGKDLSEATLTESGQLVRPCPNGDCGDLIYLEFAGAGKKTVAKSATKLAINSFGKNSAIKGGKWVSPEKWARSKANNIFKAAKQQLGKKSRSGQSSVAKNQAATKLEQMAKDKNFLQSVRTEFAKIAKKWKAQAKADNHPGTR